MSRIKKHWPMIAVAAVALALGYYAGREHLKYQLRQVIHDSLQGLDAGG